MPEIPMSKPVLAAIFILCAPVSVGAQSAPALITTVPAANAADFCYYAGLPYSRNALLSVDVPLRRESPQAVQKQLLTCKEDKSGNGLSWATTDLTRPTLGSN